MPRPKKLVVEKYLTDKQVSDLEGTWIDESFLKHPVLKENTDVTKMTKTELRKILEQRGVYPSARLRKAELLALVEK